MKKKSFSIFLALRIVISFCKAEDAKSVVFGLFR